MADIKQKKKKMNSHDPRKISATIVISVIVVMACYMSVNLFRSFIINRIETEYLEQSTFTDSTTVTGIALREEYLIVSDSDFQNIIYKISDGDRVAKQTPIAGCSEVSFSDEDNARLRFLDSRISQLQNSIKSNVSLDLPTLDNNIFTGISEFLSSMEKHNISDTMTYDDRLHIYFNQKDIKVNGTDYYKKVLEEYEEQKKELLKSYNTTETLITADKAGYFYTGYDGYEYLSADDYSEFTVAKYEELSSKPANLLPSNYIGKIELSPSWYFYCVADTSAVSNLYVGQKITVQFEFEHIGLENYSFFVSYISRSMNGKTALRLRSDTINSDVFSLRKENAQIILSSYSGFRVPNEALRVQNGKDGIFVLSAERIIFKEVNILYSTDSFSIVASASASGKRALADKDAVIIGGKELYDGKIVQQ